MIKRLTPYAASLALCALIVLFIAWFSFLSFRRYEALDTGGYDLGNMDQAAWNTLNGCILCETNVEGIDRRLAHHVEPIFLLIAPLYLIYSNPRTLLLLQTVVVALGALPVYWLARDKTKNAWVAVVFAALFLLFPALQSATLDEFHPVTLAPTFLLFAFYYLVRGKTVPYIIFLLLALSCKENISLLVIMLGLYVLFVRRDRILGLITTALGLSWFIVAVYMVIPYFNPQGKSPFLEYYDQWGDNPMEMAVTLITQPRLALELITTRQNWVYLWGLLAPVGLLPLSSLVVGFWFLATRRRRSQLQKQSVLTMVHPLLLMLVALPALAINLLSSNELMRTANVSHYSVSIVPFFVLAGIYGLAGVNDQLATLRPGSARFRKSVVWALVAGGLVLGLIYHYQQGFTPLAKGYRPVALTAHHQRVNEILPLIPPDASVSASFHVNSQVSQRERLHLWPNLHDADYVFLDVTPGPLPFIANDMVQAVQGLLQSGEYGVRTSQDGYLLLQRGLDNPHLTDEFYSFARAGDPTIQYPMNVDYGESLKFLGYDLVQSRTASAHLTLYFAVDAPVDRDYRFFLFFTDAEGNTASEEPPLTAHIRYPLSQELVATSWHAPSRWQVGEVVRADSWHWTLAKPTEFGIALGVIDGSGQWDLEQRLRPSIIEAGEDIRLVQGGTLLQLLMLRSDGRRVQKIRAAD